MQLVYNVPVPAASWNYSLLERDAANNVYLYVNGALVVTTLIHGFLGTTGQDPLVIGPGFNSYMTNFVWRNGSYGAPTSAPTVPVDITNADLAILATNEQIVDNTGNNVLFTNGISWNIASPNPSPVLGSRFRLPGPFTIQWFQNISTPPSYIPSPIVFEIIDENEDIFRVYFTNNGYSFSPEGYITYHLDITVDLNSAGKQYYYYADNSNNPVLNVSSYSPDNWQWFALTRDSANRIQL